MVNGSAGPAAELQHGDPFQQDLFQEDQPKELKDEEPAAACNLENELSEQIREEEEEAEESPKTPEEEMLKPDALDDLYTSLASSEKYINLPTLVKPLEHTVRVIKTITIVGNHFYKGEDGIINPPVIFTFCVHSQCVCK